MFCDVFLSWFIRKGGMRGDAGGVQGKTQEAIYDDLPGDLGVYTLKN